ncbi:MAG: MerR family transcriptional regulator [Thermoanaerobaculia bacterium]|nr:MerR family transcriptional regulator [Thermoanaerobaculia bacterium]
MKRRREGYVMISAVSERYNIHPQTLRLYEREGLIEPERTGGNTRIYGPPELKRLELILRLTRELGVNLAGVEVILNLCNRLDDETELDGETILDFIRREVLDRRYGVQRRHALVKVERRELQRVVRESSIEASNEEQES